MQKLLQSPVTTIVLIGLATFLAIHVVAVNSESARLDLTQDDLYSLSSGTEGILEKMHAEGVKPVDVKLYFSETAGKTLPRFIKDFITYERYLRALLQEYEVASKGKVRVSFLDPVPDSDDAQDAQDYGLDGKPVNQHGDRFFFGLVFETQTGSRDVIDFLWPNQQASVEYEISKKLHNLIWPRSQRVGVLSSLEVLGSAANPYMAQILAAQGKNPGEAWIGMQLLQESYEVEKIEADTDHISPDEFDLVVVIHPKSLGTRGRWALDEWIVRGGNALIFVDPYSIDDQPPQNPQNPLQAYQYEPSSNLEQLFAAWGLERPAGRVAADFDLALKRPVSRSGAAERVLVDLAITPETRDATLAADHPVVQGLQDLRFFTPGVLRPKETVPEGVELTPLVTTTAQGSSLEMEAGFPTEDRLTFLDLGQPAKLADRFRPGEEPVVLAYVVNGRLPSAFPDGADLPAETPAPPPGLPPGIELPEPEGGERTQKDAVQEEERGEATVMVFADVDFLSDQVAFQQSIFGAVAVNDNHKILLNAVDYLFGSEELMKVRASRTIERPFTLFDEIEAEADERSLEREKELRAEIASFEEELRQKTSTTGNVALLQKQVQDEVDLLNERIKESNRELREIRQNKRAALETEEAKVRFASMGLMPVVVSLLGSVLYLRRRKRDMAVRSGGGS
ncbi:MAG: GldG family protein [Holophagales bacterium]|nr:GldG family protein [Holophagales bacterium]